MHKVKHSITAQQGPAQVRYRASVQAHPTAAALGNQHGWPLFTSFNTEAIKIQPQTKDRNCMIYSNAFETRTSTENSHGEGVIQKAPELISQIQILSN